MPASVSYDPLFPMIDSALAAIAAVERACRAADQAAHECNRSISALARPAFQGVEFESLKDLDEHFRKACSQAPIIKALKETFNSGGREDLIERLRSIPAAAQIMRDFEELVPMVEAFEAAKAAIVAETLSPHEDALKAAYEHCDGECLKVLDMTPATHLGALAYARFALRVASYDPDLDCQELALRKLASYLALAA